MIALTDKQKRFCDEYLIDCNATQAAIRAGYSPKTAVDIGHENLNKPKLQRYINERMEQIQSNKIADATEVLEYLTSVMRGESQGEEIVIVSDGYGCSKAIHVNKYPSEFERLKAAEQLGKRYGLFKGLMNIEFENVVIVNDLIE